MQKKDERGCVEVKAAVTEVLDSKTDFIYGGEFHRESERQAWRERQELRWELQRRRPDRYAFSDRDDMDGVLPDCYAETTTKVRARYAVDGQAYESEVILSDTDGRRLAGKRIYLTLDPARPEKPLRASLYKSGGLGGLLLVYGAVVTAMIFYAAFLLRHVHLAG